MPEIMCELCEERPAIGRVTISNLLEGTVEEDLRLCDLCLRGVKESIDA